MNKLLDSLHKKILNHKFAEVVSEEEIWELVKAKERDDGWIPCSSGKMPADYGEDWVQIQIQEIGTGYMWIPRIGEYRRGSWWVLGYDEDVRVKPPFEVIAWQPLPQPYKPKFKQKVANPISEEQLAELHKNVRNI